MKVALASKGKPPSGFTLLEALVTVTVLSGLIVMLGSILSGASRSWVQSEEQIESTQNGRTALELIAREMSPSTIDTCQQLVVMPGEAMGTCGAHDVPPQSMAAFWMAPLGKDGALRVVGYYLQRDEERNLHRLKRLYIGPEDEDAYPPSTGEGGLDNPALASSMANAGRFLSGLNEEAFQDTDPQKVPLAFSVADGVIGLWFQCFDLAGNPIPWASHDEFHPETNLAFNSASLFQMASGAPFEDGTTFRYLPQSPAALKGNRLPAAVEITMVTLDPLVIDRYGGVPEMTSIVNEDTGVLDVEASEAKLYDELREQGITTANTFSTRFKIHTGT